jgi:Lar family restriction alleviation protein
MSDEEILPCPFCGSRDIHYDEELTNFMGLYCKKCGATSGFYIDKKDLIIAWNTRNGRKRKKD